MLIISKEGNRLAETDLHKALVFDEISGLVYVANRNADSDGGDAQHHYTGCKGKNGYFQYIDAQKPEVLNNIKTQVLVDPYSMALKMKEFCR